VFLSWQRANQNLDCQTGTIAMANLKNCTRLYFDENWTLVVQASPDAGTTSFVIASSGEFVPVLAAGCPANSVKLFVAPKTDCSSRSSW